MSNTFKILTEEKERILGMHKTATKNQYLNGVTQQTINEQSIPGGISKQAFDKIMSISAANRKGLRGGYLFPAQQSEINKEFGTDTYSKFYHNGGEAMLKNPQPTTDFKFYDNNPNPDAGSRYFNNTPPKTNTVVNQPTNTSQKPILDKNTVIKIQTLLKNKGAKLGNSGPKKDGIDGILGKITLAAIEVALNNPQAAQMTKDAQEPITAKPITTIDNGLVQKDTNLPNDMPNV
jgi:hypothetical protein